MTTGEARTAEAKSAAGWLLLAAILLALAAVLIGRSIFGSGRLAALPMAWAFSAGMLATLNPCGWALLPAYAAYYLGSREEGYQERP
ncbi:MAG: hypothetical protein ACE5M4_15335, partial [Anaerolineales bacterium]